MLNVELEFLDFWRENYTWKLDEIDVASPVDYILQFVQSLGGVMKASKDAIARTGKLGVQDIIENALKELNPYRPTKIYISSRTDSGVHALGNTAHFDLVRPPNKQEAFRDESLCLGLNHCVPRSEQVRFIGARRVPDNFHAQHQAIARSYVYRIAAGCKYRSLPITEKDRCWAIQSELNVEAMNEATKLFLGTHDFSAFRSASKENSFKSPIKTIDRIEIVSSHGIMDRHWSRSHAPDVQFLEFSFQSRSFVYRQIRRMVSAVVSVGKGIRSLEEVKAILESCDNAHPRVSPTAPPDGLYLKEVRYNEEDLLLHKSEDINVRPNS